MTTFQTLNPLGSKDPRDLYDNAENYDAAMNDRDHEQWTDRFGVSRPTWYGVEQRVNQFIQSSGWELPPLPYIDGIPLLVARPTQLIERDGNLYSVKLPASFPASLSGNWVDDEPLLVVRTDQALRAQLAASNGGTNVGFRSRTVDAKLNELISLADFGAVADYSGTPEYDGNDGSRITATDNTAAFSALIAEAISRGDACVHIPAGHWGIKTGQLNFSNFEHISIVGDGMDATIIDFIHEYAPVSGGNVDDATAHAIAHFSSGKSLEFIDLTIKATTKGGLVNGAPGSNWVYDGAVWGFKVQNVKHVRLNRVRVERFNYRGFSVYGPDTEKVIIDSCEGFYNAGSGFWIVDADLMIVNGGEFAYNGVQGEPGTGYGVTGSSRIDNILVFGGYYHHNYRKGLDTHGVHHFTLLGGKFQANLLSHCDVLRYGGDPTEGTTVISGSTFTSGADATERAWILAEYNLRKANGYNYAGGHVFRVIDNTAGRSKTTIIKDVSVISHYSPKRTVGFTDGGQVPFQVSTTTGDLYWIDNKIDLTGYEFPSSSVFANQTLFELTVASLEVSGGYLKCKSDGSFTNLTTSNSDTANVFILQAVSALTNKVTFNNWKMDVNNLIFSSAAITIGSGGTRSSISWANTGRVVTDCSFNWTLEPYKALGPLDRFQHNYFLGNWSKGTANSSLSYAKNNWFSSANKSYRMPDNGFGVLDDRMVFGLGLVTKAIGAQVMSVVLDKQYSSTLKLYTAGSDSAVVVSILNGDYTGITGSGSNPYLEYDSADPNYIVDGVAKLRINFKAKVALNTFPLFGEAVVYGQYPSYGIEYVFLN